MPSPAQNRDANLAELEALSPGTHSAPPTATEWVAAKGAHERHLAVVFANPSAKAAYDRFTERIRSRYKHP